MAVTEMQMGVLGMGEAVMKEGVMEIVWEESRIILEETALRPRVS
jgi:hypothetical protein